MSASDVAVVMPRDVELGLEVERLTKANKELYEQLLIERNRLTPQVESVGIDKDTRASLLGEILVLNEKVKNAEEISKVAKANESSLATYKKLKNELEVELKIQAKVYDGVIDRLTRRLSDY